MKELLAEYSDYQKENRYEGMPQNLYDPLNYLLELGGKRIRPVLVLMGYSLFKELEQDALELAQAVEVFHNFTLMHDDIMDEAPLRRGQATVHHKWDVNTAILSGDIMLIKAYGHLFNAANKNPKILKEFNFMAELVCKGQQLDMNFELEEQVALNEYMQMIEWKTAVLLAFSLKAGAMLAGSTEKISNELYRYGLEIGRGFQLMDDYLDTFGTNQKVGKQKGGDILADKKTYLMIRALEKADAQQKFTLLDLKNRERTDEKVQICTRLFLDLKVDVDLQDLIRSTFKQANDILNGLEIDYSALRDYVDQIEQRVY